jgi:NAD-dependent DNA ligase (contains BRCT domain type II)
MNNNTKMTKLTNSPNIKELIKLIQKDYKKYSNALNVSDLVKVLKKFSNVYYNTCKSLVDDYIYDYLRDLLAEKDPENEYLQEVGAPVKGTKEKVKLPFEMGSLNKFKPDTSDVARWIKQYKGPYILSDKLDGVSVQFYKNFSGDVFLYSRGDLIHGQNISHLLKYYFNDNLLNNIPNGTSIRGELIISKKNFEIISLYMKNARNASSGLVNSKTVDPKIANAVTFIAYAILNPRYTQLEQMKLLEKWKLNTVVYKEVNVLTNEILTEYLTERRKKSLFEMDGIVCIDNSTVYEHKGGFPKHAFAFKMLFDDQTAITTVIQVIWTPSKDRYLKPKIEVSPVNLSGTTITYATAHNAKFIVDNNIGPGAQIRIVRSGDVIPKILEVIKQAKTPQMPDYLYKWNKTKVDLILKTIDDNAGQQIVTIKIITNFFKRLGVKNFGEGIITKLVENGYNSLTKILKADIEKLSDIDGLGKKIVAKIYGEIDRAFEEMDFVTFMAASNKIGRGLGEKKIRAVLKLYPNLLCEKWEKKMMIDKLLEVRGFSDKLANLFVENFENFLEFYDEISKIKDISRFKELQNSSDEQEKLFSGKTIVFTGFRDNILQDKIIKNGGTVSTSISGKTWILICNDTADKSSSKFQKAVSAEIKIMTKHEFLKNSNYRQQKLMRVQ